MSTRQSQLCIQGALIFLVGFACKPDRSEIRPATAVATANTSADNIIKRSTASLLKVGNYHAELAVKTSIPNGTQAVRCNKVAATSVVKVQLPNQAFFEITQDSSQRTSTENRIRLQQFIGLTYAYTFASSLSPNGVEKRTEPGRKIDRRKVGVPGAPFDVGYPLHGSGLAQGQDLVGTCIQILSRYKFVLSAEDTATQGQPSWLLEGQYAKDAAVRDFLNERPDFVATIAEAASSSDPAVAEAVEEQVKQAASLLNVSARIRLWVGKASGLPIRFALGSNECPAMDAQIVKWEIAARPDRAWFEPSKSSADDAIEITSQILDSRKRSTGGATEGARKMVEALLRRSVH